LALLADASQIEWIHLGAEKLMDVTCMKFVKYEPSKHRDYITIQVSHDSCESHKSADKLYFRDRTADAGALLVVSADSNS
jgi:hypothetical protein